MKDNEQDDRYWDGYCDALSNDCKNEFWYSFGVLAFVFMCGLFFGFVGAML